MPGDGSNKSDADTISLEYEWDDHEPSTAVIEAIAATTGTDEIDLDPLYETVDPDALDAVVAGRSNQMTDPVVVTFNYNGYRVVVNDGGRIELDPLDVTRR